MISRRQVITLTALFPFIIAAGGSSPVPSEFPEYCEPIQGTVPPEEIYNRESGKGLIFFPNHPGIGSIESWYNIHDMDVDADLENLTLRLTGNTGNSQHPQANSNAFNQYSEVYNLEGPLVSHTPDGYVLTFMNRGFQGANLLLRDEVLARQLPASRYQVDPGLFGADMDSVIQGFEGQDLFFDRLEVRLDAQHRYQGASLVFTDNARHSVKYEIS